MAAFSHIIRSVPQLRQSFNPSIGKSRAIFLNPIPGISRKPALSSALDALLSLARDSMPKAKIYLDANVFKFSATHLVQFRPREVIITWGGIARPSTVHNPVIVNPNDAIENPELRREADLLPQVAELAATGLADFLINIETKMEVWGLPSLDSQTGGFYGAPVTAVDAPIQYGRVMFGGPTDYKEEQFSFLCSLRHERFRELQRITGAYQGETKTNRNQLLDAFHLWCAEHNKCDFFLSLDFKLARVIGKSKNKPKVPIIKPSELLNALREGADRQPGAPS
jgi:hypothetical protein